VPQGQTTGAYSAYATLALGSALALLLYPHTMTATLSATSGHTVRRNAALLPAYTFVLGLLALLGFSPLRTASTNYRSSPKGFGSSRTISRCGTFPAPLPVLVRRRRLRGHRDRRLGAGSHHVDRGRQSVHAHIYREFFNAHVTDKQEAQMAKWMSLIVKFGALIFIVFLPLQYAIQLQLLGGIWIIQTLPAVLVGLYTRWLNRGPGDRMGGRHLRRHLYGGSVNFAASYPLAIGGWTFPGYIALYTLILNLVIAIVLTPVMNALGVNPEDQTAAADYYA